jgi:hypothetical protein
LESDLQFLLEIEIKCDLAPANSCFPKAFSIGAGFQGKDPGHIAA